MTSESSIEMSVAPSFDDVADELYGYPPHMFATVRAQRADQVRTAGASDVAARIEQLRVPSAAAWLSNQLVRHFRDQVLVLLDLGRALQVATDALATDALTTNAVTTDAVTTNALTANALTANAVTTNAPTTAAPEADVLPRLDQRRRDVYNELHRRAAWLAVEDRVTAGRPVLRGLGDSLHSAMCSESMAQQMLSGRLVRPLPRISWPGLTPDHFPDEVARRRALRVARGVEGRPSRYTTDDDATDDDEYAPLATVTDLRARTR